jgi:hypothetical protein
MPDLNELRDRLLDAAHRLMNERDEAAADPAKVAVAEAEFDRIEVVLARLQEIANVATASEMNALADRLQHSIRNQRAIGLTSAVGSLQEIVSRLRGKAAPEASGEARDDAQPDEPEDDVATAQLNELRDQLLDAANRLMNERDAAAGDAAKVAVAQAEFDRIEGILARMQEIANAELVLDLDAVAARIEQSIAAQRAAGLSTAVGTLKDIVSRLRGAAAADSTAERPDDTATSRSFDPAGPGEALDDAEPSELNELRDRLLSAAHRLMNERDAAADDPVKVAVAEAEFDRIDVILVTIQEVINTRQALDLDAVASRLQHSIERQRAVGLTSAIGALRDIIADLGGDEEPEPPRPDGPPEDGGSVVQKLRQQIAAGKIRFDAARLERELLGLNAGITVSPKLQSLVLTLSELAQSHIRVSSLLRTGTASHHTTGRAVDIGNEEIAGDLLPRIATDAQVAALGIDEVIFDAALVGSGDRNKWNYDRGRKHKFDTVTLNAHGNHIHFAVKA